MAGKLKDIIIHLDYEDKYKDGKVEVNIIASEPEELIKCKDCERVRFDYHDKQYPCFCDKWLQGVKYNDYCSYGKRREDDESN